MAVGIAPGVANAILDAYCLLFFVKLHVGDPGSAGTANAAGETDRQLAVFSPAAAAAVTNLSALTWTGVSSAETYTHVSYWDTVGPAGGTFKGSGVITDPDNVVVGADFVIPAGDLDISLVPVAV